MMIGEVSDFRKPMDQSIKRRLLSGGAWVFGGRSFFFISQLFVNALLARLLTPNDMGLFFLVSSVVHFFMMFALFGMKRSIVRIITESLALENVGRAHQAVKNVLQLGLLTSVMLAVLLVSGAGKFVMQKVFGSAVMGDIRYLPAIWLVVFTLQTLIAESFRGYHNIKLATIFNGLVSSVISALVLGVIFLAHQKVDLQTALSIIISSYAINLILSFYFLQTSTGGLTSTSNGQFSRSLLLKNSWVLYSTDILLFLMTAGHLWLLAYFSTKDNVAIYGAVMRLMVIITTTLAVLRLTILPSIGQLYAKKRFAEIEKVLRVSSTIAGVPAIIGLLLIITLGKSFLYLIFGSHYTAGYSALIVLAVANLINVLTGTPGPLMIMASKEKYLCFFALFSGSIAIGLSMMLVGRFHYLGVSIGAGTGIVLYNVLMATYCQKVLSINTLMSLSEIINFSYRCGHAARGLSLSRVFRKLFRRPSDNH